MAEDPTLIIQIPRGGALERQLAAGLPVSVSEGQVVIEHEETDSTGALERQAAGEVVLSVPSPEELAHDAGEVRRVIERAGTGIEPLVIVVEAAEEIRQEELAPVLDAAHLSHRPVILRVIRNA